MKQQLLDVSHRMRFDAPPREFWKLLDTIRRPDPPVLRPKEEIPSSLAIEKQHSDI